MNKKKKIIIISLVVLAIILITVSLILIFANRDLRNWQDYIYDTSSNFKEYDFSEESDEQLQDTATNVYTEKMTFAGFEGTAYFYRYANNEVRNSFQIRLNTANSEQFEQDLNTITTALTDLTGYAGKVMRSHKVIKETVDNVDYIAQIRSGSISVTSTFSIDDKYFEIIFYPYNNNIYALLNYYSF